MAQSLPAAAIEDYTAALRFSDSCSDAHCYRANAYLELGELAKARADFEVALSLQADHPYALGGLANVALKLCDWDLVNKISGKLDKHVMAGKIQPGVLLGYTDDPDLINRCAKKHVEQRASSRVNNAAPSSPFSYHDKIRVAYLSPDFNRHATAYLIAELIELHDRSRFEITGISFGRNDDSHIRNRIASGFDSFHDMRCRCDSEVVALLHEKEIDIAVDLCGHMHNNRFRIFSYRPCPIQVSFLGYPGTTGANYIDYIIADKVVAPLAHQRHFSEKIVQLPRSYQVNDTTRKPKGGDISRDSVGLPEDKFVFCCFNGNWKITRPIFEIWMRLLKKLPHSVLWLLADNSYSQKALETAAAQNGIGAGRLVFSRRTSIDCHLMRHRLADLYLDTTPYGAHTAANDALRMGLPILTMLGSAFQSRVAASLLMAARLPELVTNDLSEYERLAFVLAKEPERLAGVKARCAKVVESPLFDGHLFRRDIESAFRKMWNIWRLGQKPVSFSVD